MGGDHTNGTTSSSQNFSTGKHIIKTKKADEAASNRRGCVRGPCTAVCIGLGSLVAATVVDSGGGGRATTSSKIKWRGKSQSDGGSTNKESSELHLEELGLRFDWGIRRM